MKSRFLIIMLSGFMLNVFGQDPGNYTAMILSLTGNGVIIRNSQKIPLELPQSYFPGDKLSVEQGSALILLFSGEEIPLAAVSNYTIPAENNSVSSDLYEMANDSRSQSLLAQSGMAYQIRGKGNVFPMKSKVLRTDNVVLQLRYENPEDLKLGIKVMDSQTQKILFEKENISDSIISLSDVEWQDGRSYYWTLSNTPDGKPEMGTIVVPADKEKENLLEIPEPHTHFEYMNLISSLYNSRYYFDAYKLIEEARAKYPDFKIYNILSENILLE